MSTPDEREKRNHRLQQDENVIARQVKISKSSLDGVHAPEHSFVKRHSTNCGDPGCHMCGNPRKFFKEETMQERSHKQDKFWDADDATDN